MKYKGKDLEFISIILRDGSGTRPINDDYYELINAETFDVICLSKSLDTYIAHGFNSFVVKIKNIQEWIG